MVAGDQFVLATRIVRGYEGVTPHPRLLSDSERGEGEIGWDKPFIERVCR